MKYLLYRPLMRLSHRFNWHHMKVCHLEDGATMHWCQWCGVRQVTPRPSKPPLSKAAP